MGEALALVHQNRLLHQDMKLQNIMVRADQSEAVLTEILHHSQVRPKVYLELKFKAHSPSPFQWTELLTQSYKDECELIAVGFQWGSFFAHVKIGRLVECQLS